jgi:geranylgeranyl diphosphate synthase type I
MLVTDSFNTAWIDHVHRGVGACLKQFFRDKRQNMLELSPSSLKLLNAVEDLTDRGGKRLRPVVLYAGARAVNSDPDLATLWKAGAALELLQTYLLIHDDWMDQDNERRGGKAVHVHFADATNDTHLGASLAVLAGDLASAYAWELMSSCLANSPAQTKLLALFARIHQEVVMGQHQDLLNEGGIDSIYDLKTGSYTVRGPLLLGGIIGGASETQLAGLQALAKPLGIAFQLRDDLLGTFGDAATLGKPVGNDLRRGKFTAITVEADATLNPDGLALVA